MEWSLAALRPAENGVLMWADTPLGSTAIRTS